MDKLNEENVYDLSYKLKDASLYKIIKFIYRYPKAIPKYSSQIQSALTNLEDYYLYHPDLIEALIYTIDENEKYGSLRLLNLYTIWYFNNGACKLRSSSVTDLTERDWIYHAIMVLYEYTENQNDVDILQFLRDNVMIDQNKKVKLMQTISLLILNTLPGAEIPDVVATMIGKSIFLTDIAEWATFDLYSNMKEKIEATTEISSYYNTDDLLEKAFQVVTILYNMWHFDRYTKSMDLNLFAVLKEYKDTLLSNEIITFFENFYKKYLGDYVMIAVAECRNLFMEATAPKITNTSYNTILKNLVNYRNYLADHFNWSGAFLFIKDVYFKTIARTPQLDDMIHYFVLNQETDLSPEVKQEYDTLFCEDFDQIACEKLPEIEEAATEGRDKKSKAMSKAETKIFHAYRSYKDQEMKFDSQATKLLRAIKKIALGDTRTEIIEGKQITVVGALKKLLAAATLFSFGPIKAAIALVARYALKKNVSNSERRKIVSDLNAEIAIINEKIEDAKGDGNRKAKYNMMRTKNELIKARNRIQVGVSNDAKSIKAAKQALDNAEEE